MDSLSRRGFLEMTIAAPAALRSLHSITAEIPGAFPQQDPRTVQEIVGVSHRDIVRVKELVSGRPALARAAWDWGYGDWETALGAASHVGNKEIAAFLLAAGAHPTIFSAAMLGHLDAVKAFVAVSPGIQRTRGPHGISLLSHAKAGESTEVVKYLESLGDADPRYPNEPLAARDPDGLVGVYAFGPATTDRIVVSMNSRGGLRARREGRNDQNLFHHGGRVFNPAGAEAVRLKFEPPTGRATSLMVIDGPIQVRGSRS